MFSKILGLAFGLILIFVLSIMASNHNRSDKPAETTIKGKLVCTGCELKKNEGAKAACKVYGHKHALKTSDGNYVNLLENQYSEDLLTGKKYHNKEITVHGRHFIHANLIDVKSFEVDGKKKAWCNGCATMDGCSASSK